MSGSQPWLHVRMFQKVFKNSSSGTPPSEMLTEFAWGGALVTMWLALQLCVVVPS